MTTANNLIVAEFDGKPVQFDAVAWFNATHAAKRFGKRPVDWLRLRSTIEYIETLREVLGISEEITLIRARRNGGAQIHPDLALAVARQGESNTGKSGNWIRTERGQHGHIRLSGGVA